MNQIYDGEIELILSQSNGSASYNVNRGIKAATGEFIKYLCEDDTLPPFSIRDSVQAIGSGLALQGCAINRFSTHDSFHGAVKNITLNEMLKHNQIHAGGLMYHRSIFEHFGYFDETLKTGEEYEFNLRLLKHGVTFKHCSKPLYIYRRHDEQKSLGIAANQEWRKEVITEIKNRYK
jgi:glycosyltransferase involved in cell wall biosynthesis